MANFGNLNLSPPISLEDGVAMLTVVDQALQATASRGFIFPNRPDPSRYSGMLPQDLSRLDDNKLGDLLDAVAAWCTWASSELSMARQALKQAESILKMTRSRLRLAVKAGEEKKLSNPDKDDVVECDPRYKEKERTYLYCEAMFDFVRLQYDAATRDWDTVSRHITQRGQEIDRMTRGSNIGNVPVSSSAFRRG